MTPNEFITELVTLYGPPNTDNPTRYKQIMLDTLSAFPEAALELGCDALLQDWKYRRWPTPAEVRGYLNEASSKLAESGAISTKPYEKGCVWHAAEDFTESWFRARANPELIDAAELEGWTPELWQAVKSQAWSILVQGWTNGAPTYKPTFEQIGMSPDSRDYYRARARAYREGELYQKTEEYQSKHGQRARLHGVAVQRIKAELDSDAA